MYLHLQPFKIEAIFRYATDNYLIVTVGREDLALSSFDEVLKKALPQKLVLATLH